MKNTTHTNTEMVKEIDGTPMTYADYYEEKYGDVTNKEEMEAFEMDMSEDVLKIGQGGNFDSITFLDDTQAHFFKGDGSFEDTTFISVA